MIDTEWERAAARWPKGRRWQALAERMNRRGDLPVTMLACRCLPPLREMDWHLAPDERAP